MKIEAPTCAGAVAPDRFRWFETRGARLRTYEWGDPKATPVLAAHGFFDHGRGYDLLAPLLAEKYHVISFDARGHGESSWTDTYAWNMDVHDLVCMLRELGRATHLIGHSKGGGQALDLERRCYRRRRGTSVVASRGGSAREPVDVERFQHCLGRPASGLQ